MGNQLIERHFGKIGARVKVGFARQRIYPTYTFTDPTGIDIKSDRNGEFFDIQKHPDESISYEVVDLKPDIRHLLLMARRSDRKDKFLCGHDERHWFVCAVPGSSVSGVDGAMEALQPPEVQNSVERKLKRIKNRFTRKNEAFLRQGEWYFIPVREIDSLGTSFGILRNEPITRGNGSKPHICEEVLRFRGHAVMVSAYEPAGISIDDYNQLVRANPEAKRWRWRQMQRDADVYARGTVRHPDHKTICLNGWHRVLMNTENLAPGMEHVTFLD